MSRYKIKDYDAVFSELKIRLKPNYNIDSCVLDFEITAAELLHEATYFNK